MPCHRYGVYESVGSGREAVSSYVDLHHHHPSMGLQEKGRTYQKVMGKMEEVVHIDGKTMVSKDFVLYDSTGIRRIDQVNDAHKKVPVPAPFAGVVEVNPARTKLIIRDPAINEPLAQVRHMSDISLKTGDTVKYGQPLGTQSKTGTVHVHTHVDVNINYIREFDQYIKDLRSGAITTQGHCPTRASHDAERFIDQAGPGLASLGMAVREIEILATAAASECARYAAQGETSEFLVSKDGRTIALRQEFPPLREFSVAQALARSEQQHWGEAVPQHQDTSAALRTEHSPQGMVAQGFAQGAPEYRVRA